MKKTLVCLILILCFLISAMGAFAETDAETSAEDRGRVLATFDGEPIYEDTLLAAISTIYSYGYIESETDYYGALEYIAEVQLTAEAKVKELGFDQFTDEENASIREKALAAFEADVAEMVNTYISYGYAEDTEESRAELAEMCVQYLSDYGYNMDYYIQTYENDVSLTKLMESIDVGEVTAEDVQKVFDESVESDRSMFADDIRSYEYYSYWLGYDIWYTPAGYRNILQIVLTADSDLVNAYTTIKKDTEASEEDIAAALEAVIENRRETVDEIYNRLESGEAFEDLIAEYNEGTETRGVTPGSPMMVNTVSTIWNDGVIDAAFDAQMVSVGDYSQPHVDKSGIHIAYYLSDVEAGPIELTDSIYASIEQYLISTRMGEAVHER